MERKHVKAIRDEKADFPEAANARLKAFRQVFKWAIDNEVAHQDPAHGVKYLGSNSDGFHTWTEQEVHQYEAQHPVGTKARLALALLLYTGVRRSDVVKLGRPMESDGILRFKETKGANIKSSKRRQRGTSVKERFTAAGFGNRFRDWCNEAGPQHCSAHGCRKAGAMIAAENGATSHQLMAIFGWETLRQAEPTPGRPIEAGSRSARCTCSCPSRRSKRAGNCRTFRGAARGVPLRR